MVGGDLVLTVSCQDPGHEARTQEDRMIEWDIIVTFRNSPALTVEIRSPYFDYSHGVLCIRLPGNPMQFKYYPLDLIEMIEVRQVVQ
jgi:hypothetical protein